MSEEVQQAPPPATHPPNQQLPPLPPRLSVHDIRNSDLVSRYMAATPPYLYSSPVGPQNFFFSDMLRSIVQNRNAEQAARSANNHNNNSSSGTQPLGRRSRKRAWGQTRSQFDASIGKECKLQSGGAKNAPEKPLELTNKCLSPMMKFAKSELQSDALKGLALKHSLAEYSQTQLNNNNNIHIPPEPPSLTNNSTATTPSSDLVLPPPPPMWYPPLYPPYGIDPLHFFIDLRVSGHIYDRKKENTSPNSSPSANVDDSINSGKPRLGSAFSVPPSRRDNKSPSSRALNLTSTSPTSGEKHSFNHTYDHSMEASANDKESSSMLLNGKNANYVLQNLPRIYTDLSSAHIGGASSGVEERNSVHSDETTDCKSEVDESDVAGRHSDQHGGDVHEITDRDEDPNDVVIVDNKNGSGY